MGKLVQLNVKRVVSYEDYKSHPQDYAQRTNPEKLNWGPYMKYHDLQDAGFSANRVSIPGDWDFDEKVV